MRLAGYLLALRKNGLDVVQRDRRGAAFIALNHAGDQLAAEFLVFVIQGVALGLADLLDHHLLGGLSPDPLGNLRGIHGLAIMGAADVTALAVN